MLKYHRSIFVVLILLLACRSPADNKQQKTALPDQGAEMFARYGCATCHSLDGSEMYGPPLNNIYQRKISVIRDGQVKDLEVNRKYLKRSIIDPGFEKLVGYEDRLMPEPIISPRDVDVLVEYLIGKEE